MSAKMSNGEFKNDVAMRGKGVYGANSGQQHSAMLSALPLITKSVADSWGKRPYTDRPFTIAEYGCSDGKNSVEPIAAALRGTADAKHVQLFLSDQPSNDFAATSKNVQKIEEDGEKDGISIFTAMVPRSFYKQVLAPNSADMGFSLMSIHYVDKMPPLREGEFPFDTSRKETRRQTWEKDFCSFLRLRSSELVDGSSLVLSQLSEPPEGGDNFAVVGQALGAGAQDMIKDNLLSHDLFKHFELPTWYPEPERMRELVASVGGWAVKDLFQQEIEHPASVELKKRRAEKEDPEDLEWYAGKVIDWLAAVVSGYFLKTVAITTGDMNEEQREKLLQEWISRSKKRFLADSKDAKVTSWLVFARLQKC
ncbi:S-adenosyl-L-methionine-dependent methyltransferase [Phyllosticta capitalensis]